MAAALGGEPRAELRLEVGAALGRHADRLQQLVLGRLLGQVARRAQPQRLGGEARIALRREHDHARPLVMLPQARDRGQARLARHVQVEDEDVRAQSLDRLEGRRDVARLAHHLETRLRLHEQAQAAADDDVVVREDESEGPARLRGA